MIVLQNSSLVFDHPDSNIRDFKWTIICLRIVGKVVKIETSELVTKALNLLPRLQKWTTVDMLTWCVLARNFIQLRLRRPFPQPWKLDWNDHILSQLDLYLHLVAGQLIIAEVWTYLVSISTSFVYLNFLKIENYNFMLPCA